MTLICFASAKGSPGVTTLVTTLASVWSTDPVVAELDPAGGDVAFRHTLEDGSPLVEERGLLSFGAAIRGGLDVDIADHLQRTDDGLDILAGVSSPGQVRGLTAAWPHIAKGLRTSDGDVLADCGRFVPGSPVTPVFENASALVLVARNDVPGIAHLRQRLTALQEAARRGGMESVRLGHLVVGDPTDSREAADIDKLLASSGLTSEGLGVVAHDSKTVGELHHASARRLRRSLYIRSVLEVGSRIRSWAGVRTPELQRQEA